MSLIKYFTLLNLICGVSHFSMWCRCTVWHGRSKVVVVVLKRLYLTPLVLLYCNPYIIYYTMDALRCYVFPTFLYVFTLNFEKLRKLNNCLNVSEFMQIFVKHVYEVCRGIISRISRREVGQTTLKMSKDIWSLSLYIGGN